MPRGNPDSKRGQVKARYASGGEEAAALLGAELGVKESRLKRWFRLWSGAAKAPTKDDTDIAALRRRPVRPGPDRVYLTWKDPCHGGTVVKRGPEQSEVKWDNGNVIVVSNDWITPIPTDDQPPVTPKEKPPTRRRLKKTVETPAQD
jgi:hypothetical protein